MCSGEWLVEKLHGTLFLVTRHSPLTAMLLSASVFDLPSHLLKKSRIDDVPGAAASPKDVSMDGTKFNKRFNFQPRSVHDGIKAMASFSRTIS